MLVSILFFFQKYCCVDWPYCIYYIFYIEELSGEVFSM
jgi:hypothetical protein